MGADGRVAVTSQLNISRQEWKTGKVFTCNVSDISLKKNVSKSISLCSGKMKLYSNNHLKTLGVN